MCRQTSVPNQDPNANAPISAQDLQQVLDSECPVQQWQPDHQESQRSRDRPAPELRLPLREAYSIPNGTHSISDFNAR